MILISMQSKNITFDHYTATKMDCKNIHNILFRPGQIARPISAKPQRHARFFGRAHLALQKRKKH